MQTQETTLDKVICFDLSAISLWSGRRKLRVTDLKLKDAAEIPPEAIASLGSKKIIDPQTIADFEALKKEAHRECAKVGIRFLSGYAVPDAAAGDLGKALEAIRDRFDTYKTDFLNEYQDTVTTWVEKHPDWSAMLNQAALTRAEVEAKLNFGYRAFRVVAAGDNDDDQDALNQGLKTELSGLSGQLYREVAQAARHVQEKSLMGRDRVNQKILSPVRTIRGKLQGLAFLDKRVTPLISTIDHVVAQLPKAGWIDSFGLAAIQGLIFILSDEERMMSHGQAILEGTDVSDAFEESTPGFDVAPEPEQPESVDATAIDDSAINIPAPSVGGEDLFAPAIASEVEQKPSFDLSDVLVAPPPPVAKPANVFRLFD